MDGRNALGRRISLLNDLQEDAAPGRTARLTSLAFQHSRTPSYASSPNSSPPTPQLVRSESSDSSAMDRTPSPITPSFDYHGLAVHQKSGDAAFAPQSSFFSPQSDPSVASYPSIPPNHAAQFSYSAPSAIAPQPALYQPAQPLSEADSKLSAKQATKKNQYPCPLAKKYNCNDFFTTSGHAARHAKKHTGKKDAFCPECNKAFTRKDNMEQHRRTHQNGRNSIKNSESQPKRQKTAKRSSTSANEKAVPLQTSLPSALDPSLPQSPASSFGFPETAFPPPTIQTTGLPYPAELLQSPFGVNSPYTMAVGPYDPALATMTGLDTLAIAASKRDADF